MNKDIAKALMTLAVATDEPLGKMLGIVERIEDGKLRDRYKKAVGDVIGAIFREIIYPIEEMYPDLTPDNDELSSPRFGRLRKIASLATRLRK